MEKIKLSRELKIALLEAVKDGEISADVLDAIGRIQPYENMSKEEVLRAAMTIYYKMEASTIREIAEAELRYCNREISRQELIEFCVEKRM